MFSLQTSLLLPVTLSQKSVIYLWLFLQHPIIYWKPNKVYFMFLRGQTILLYVLTFSLSFSTLWPFISSIYSFSLSISIHSPHCCQIYLLIHPLIWPLLWVMLAKIDKETWTRSIHQELGWKGGTLWKAAGGKKTYYQSLPCLHRPYIKLLRRQQDRDLQQEHTSWVARWEISEITFCGRTSYLPT